MRVFISFSRITLYSAAGLAALSLCGPALAGSWSSTMQVSATVVSSCTLTVTRNHARPWIQSRCTRGEQPRVSLTAAPVPPVAIQREAGQGGSEFVVVTY